MSEPDDASAWENLQAIKVSIGGGWTVAFAWSKAGAIGDLREKRPDSWIAFFSFFAPSREILFLETVRNFPASDFPPAARREVRWLGRVR